jgi:hypothetical protein
MSLISVAELINDGDFAQSFTITRRIGKWVKGRWTDAGTIDEVVTGVIQPANTDDIEMLPSGDAIRGAIKIHTLEPLRVTNEANKTKCDEVTWRGEAYKVVQVDDFSQNGYYKALAVRRDIS